MSQPTEHPELLIIPLSTLQFHNDELASVETTPVWHSTGTALCRAVSY